MNNPAASCGVSNTQTKKSLVASHGELNPERLKSTLSMRRKRCLGWREFQKVEADYLAKGLLELGA